MQVRLLALVAAVGAIAAMNACGDPTAIKAQFDNADRPNLTLYALNGTLPSLPSAIQIRAASTTRVDASFNFDVAFDIDTSGKVLAYPVRAVAAEFVGAHQVGLLQTDKSFDDALTAPTGGYKYDSVMVVPVGKTVFVDVIDRNSCSIYSLLGQQIKAKFVIDSVNTSSRRVFVHLLANQNCGFKSLVKGEPKD